MAASKEEIKDAVAKIVGGAARDALDFKQCDPSSTTRTDDCIQVHYENHRANALRDAEEGTAHWGVKSRTAAVARVNQLWDDVRVALNSIGYTW